MFRSPSSEPTSDRYHWTGLVIEPLGLNDTSFTVAEPNRLAAGYGEDNGTPRRMADLEIIRLPFIEGSEGLRMSLTRTFRLEQA